MLRRLAYASRATQAMNETALSEILAVARHKNDANQVTGMLVYCEGDFLQVIEGEDRVIEALYDRIADDPRHQNCRIWSDKSVTERLFANWNMGFKATSKATLASIPGYIDFFDPALDVAALNQPIETEQFMLMAFRSLNVEAAK